MIAYKADRVWHFHEFKQNFDWVRTSVEDISEHIQRIRVLKIYPVEYCNVLVVLTVNVRYYVCPL